MHTGGDVARMRGVDAGYLYMETPTMHMHTLKVAILDPSEPFKLERLETALMARLPLLPPFSRRVVPAPLSLNHPLWVSDRIDPARHLFQHRLPVPGEMRELEAVIGQIASTPLQRDVPLWEIHVCEGLPGNRIGVVVKMHHALADGVAANALLANVTDAPGGPPDSPETTKLPSTWAEPEPARGRQVVLALRDAIRQTLTLPGLLWRTGAAVLALVRHKRASDVDVPRPVLDVPRVSFNGALSPERSFATCSLPLADLKQVRRIYDVTLNDVVLAIVAGALRRWMDLRGEHPAASLVAGVPVGADEPGAPPRLGGNRVSNLFTSLATDIDDPVERLQSISRTTAESKLVQKMLGRDMLVDWVQFAPPAPLTAAMRLYSRTRAASRHSAPFNVVVSNVPGPRNPVTIAGASLADLYSVGPIMEGIGLNVTAWSYVDRMNFSLLTCPHLLGDLQPLVAQMRPALDELLDHERATR